MRVIVEKTPEAASQRAARYVASLVREKPICVLGLATGGTPLKLYGELIRMHQEEGLDFSRTTSFNLDEYVGLPPTHEQSYRYFMQHNLFDKINIDVRNTHVPDGRALDFDKYCEHYEQMIVDNGGIDLQILGIGTDGHIAFNEPGSSLGSRTRLKTLAPETVKDNARFFGGEKLVPRLAVTMGVGTILESKKCALLAFGENKAEAIALAVEGPVTAQVTASALQMHREVHVFLDEGSAAHLARREYYDEVEKAHQMLETGKLSWTDD
ncbi:MAG: glucosamine-6-phosphate deaminase [Blastopirellula sp.]|nr:MAG: glucosamine-6-phosphate deaminase [Blastopirellula sp.]